jgi:UDP-N-acetylmuramate dehydrogenase
VKTLTSLPPESAYHAALAELRERLGAGVRVNEPMANHTSLRVGGPADLFLVARTTARLIEAVDLASDVGVPWRVIGAASNLLIADDGVDGLVVKAAMSGRSRRTSSHSTQVLVDAEAGCILASLARDLARDGLAGLEWAVNVPGTVGAAVVDNSGAFGSSTAECLVEADLYVPGEGRRTLGPEQLGMAYRTSFLKRGALRAIVLRGTFLVTPGDGTEILARMRATQRTRQKTQPTGPSLGSMFANPPADAAGRLIEAADLKGQRNGSAEISPLHANFMLNRGGARARDVFALMQQVQHAVWRQFGCWLNPEVQLVGRWRDHDRLALYSPPGNSSEARLPAAPTKSAQPSRASN